MCAVSQIFQDNQVGICENILGLLKAHTMLRLILTVLLLIPLEIFAI